MVDDARLRTQVVRYLRERDGAECSIDEIVGSTGLRPDEVRAGIDHNHFVDSLKPNLYYGVIQKVEKGGRVTYRFNKVQYHQNRSRWIDAGGRGGRGGGGQEGITLPRPPRVFNWLRRGKGGD